MSLDLHFFHLFLIFFHFGFLVLTEAEYDRYYISLEDQIEFDENGPLIKPVIN